MEKVCNRWRKPKLKCRSSKRQVHLEKLGVSRRGKSKPSGASTSAPSLPTSKVMGNDSELLLIEKSQLEKLVENIICDSCQEKTVAVKISDRCGLSCKIALHCDGCSNSLGVIYSSSRVDYTSNRQAPFSIYRRAVQSATSIGIGNAALEKFFMNLNVKPMSSRTFRSHFNALSKDVMEIEAKVLAEARSQVREAYIEANGLVVNDTDIIDISVSYDDTWHKRGHTSLYGVGIAIDIVTGLAVDFQVLSKYCHKCTMTAAVLGADSTEFSIWYENHISSDECEINFNGPSGSMEVKAAEMIWCRSMERHQLRYTTMMCDGDARTWTHLNKISPYGPDMEITKEE